MNYLEKVRTELKLKGNSEKTISSYSFFINKFIKNINPETASLDDIKTFLASQIDNYSRKSQSLLISSLRFFYTNIIDKPEIVIKLKTPKKEKKIPIVLTKEEVKLLIDNADYEKTKLMVKTLYSTGLRVSELTNLTPKDLDLNNINAQEYTDNNEKIKQKSKHKQKNNSTYFKTFFCNTFTRKRS